MNQKKSICVFCGSSGVTDKKYRALASDTGKLIADAGLGVVYGGSRAGLMGALADAALAAGGEVFGVIPYFLKDKEVAHTGLTELHITRTMHERQVGMAERADAFLILPGGLGTLAEFFEAVTWRLLGLHNKPIAVLNLYGYWDELLAFMDHAGREKFLYAEGPGLFTVLKSMKDLEAFIGLAGADLKK